MGRKEKIVKIGPKKNTVFAWLGLRLINGDYDDMYFKIMYLQMGKNAYHTSKVAYHRPLKT